MKITTQRHILWGVNFLLVLGLLGFVFLMQQNAPKARNKRHKDFARRVEAAINKVKLPRESGGNRRAARTKLTTFLSRDFVFEGYVPPRKVTPRQRDTQKKKAPPLDSLIEVDVVLAPEHASSPSGGQGGPEVLNAGAFIKIKSVKSDNFSTYWYRVGETIGAGHDSRADKDPVLQKWGPCVLLEVAPDGIVCSWNKETDRAKVPIKVHPDPDKVWIEGRVGDRRIKLGGPGSINNLDPGKGIVTPAGIGLSLFKPGKTKDNRQIIELTREGIALFDRGEGEKLLEELGTKPTKSGLQVTSIPKRMRELGLQEGDVVIKVDNVAVKNRATVTNYVRKTYRQKKQFEVTVLRNGRQRIFNVRVPKNTKGLGQKGRGIRFGR